jgi:hypothetical protein
VEVLDLLLDLGHGGPVLLHELARVLGHGGQGYLRDEGKIKECS